MMIRRNSTFEKSPILPRWQLAALVAVPLLLVVIGGCGGGDKDEQQAAAEKPHHLVPANLDTLIAETGRVSQDYTTDTDSPVGADTGLAGEPVNEPVGNPVETGSSDLGQQAAESAAPVVEQTQPGSGPFSLQLGSFQNEAYAVERAFKIKALGYPSSVEMADVGGLTYHRVFVRGLADRVEAENLGEELRSGLGITYLVLRQH